MTKILDAEKIHHAVMVKIHNGSDYMSAVLEYCTEHGYEVEMIGDIIKKSPILKAKIQAEVSKLRLLKSDEKEVNLFE